MSTSTYRVTADVGTARWTSTQSSWNALVEEVRQHAQSVHGGRVTATPTAGGRITQIMTYKDSSIYLNSYTIETR